MSLLLVLQPQEIHPSFIASTEVVYNPALQLEIKPSFIASAEAVYIPTVGEAIFPVFIGGAEIVYIPEIKKQAIAPPFFSGGGGGGPTTHDLLDQLRAQRDAARRALELEIQKIRELRKEKQIVQAQLKQEIKETTNAIGVVIATGIVITVLGKLVK